MPMQSVFAVLRMCVALNKKSTMQQQTVIIS